MGSWGTGIYSNDTSEDVRDICKEIFPFVSVEEGNQIIFKEYKELIEQNRIDDDYASFWYALADWQWKHGILSEQIRSKTIELLNMHAGISDWEESATAADVKKRLNVMEKLKAQLETPMPPIKIPKGKLLKPKHKVGDVIIFEAGVKGTKYNDGIWENTRITPYPFYADSIIRDFEMDLTTPIVVENQYLAILCVEISKELHSKYLPELYDEHSVYVMYDYCDKQKPSLDILQQCGFLPRITHESHYVTVEVGKMYNRCYNIRWVYKFTTSSDFKHNYFGVGTIEKVQCLKETERFHTQLSKKSYSGDSVWELDLDRAFGDFTDEKIRLSALNIDVDLLLDDNVVNPTLLKEYWHSGHGEKYIE